MLAQFSWVAFGRVSAALLQMVSLGLVAAWAGPADFGLLAAFLGLVVIPQVASDFGITTFVTKARAASVDDGIVTYSLRVNAGVSVILILASAMALIAGACWLSPLFWSMLPLAVWVGAQRNADVWATVALADGKAHVVTISLVGGRIVIVVLQLLLYALGAGSIVGYSVACAIGSISSALYMRRNVAPVLPPIDDGMQFRVLLRTTWPYWLHSSTTQIRNADTALVAAIASPVAAGMYAVASRLTGPLRILPTSFAAVLLPGLTRRGGELNARVRLGLVGLVGVLAVFYAGIALAAEWAVPFLLGSEYQDSVPAVQVVCFGLVFGAAASLLASVLQSRGLQRQTGYVSLCAALYCLVAIVVGAAQWGAVGAAGGLVSSFALQSGLALVILWSTSRKGRKA